MSQNDNNEKNNAKNQGPSFGTKLGYIGTGVLIGLVAYPFVRKALAKVQPQMDKIFDDLTGRAENLAERTSDLLARARESLKNSEVAEETRAHSHSHDE